MLEIYRPKSLSFTPLVFDEPYQWQGTQVAARNVMCPECLSVLSILRGFIKEQINGAIERRCLPHAVALIHDRHAGTPLDNDCLNDGFAAKRNKRGGDWKGFNMHPSSERLAECRPQK
jgi:hypothetical protein